MGALDDTQPGLAQRRPSVTPVDKSAHKRIDRLDAEVFGQPGEPGLKTAVAMIGEATRRTESKVDKLHTLVGNIDRTPGAIWWVVGIAFGVSTVALGVYILRQLGQL